MLLVILFWIALGVITAASCLFVAFSGSGSVDWGVVPDGVRVQGAGAYRQVAVQAWKKGSAPLVVRAAALTSLLLGILVVPGVLAALVGVFAVFAFPREPYIAILTLSAPTGLYVAGRLLGAGRALIGREHAAVRHARATAIWALGHNLVLMGALLLEAALSARAYRAIEALWLPGIYALVSIAQALLVWRAAEALEAYNAASRSAAEVESNGITAVVNDAA